MTEQKKALDAVASACMQANGAAGKLRAGDLHGAQARLAFALRDISNAIEEINAATALSHATQGYIPALP